MGKIDRIHYQKVFPTGSYLTERIGFECTIDEYDDPESMVESLRQMAEDIHKAKYPHYYTKDGKAKVDPPHREEPAVQIREEAPPAAEETVEDKRWRAIIGCTTSTQELEKWRPKVPERFYQLFDDRYTELFAKENQQPATV